MRKSLVCQQCGQPISGDYVIAGSVSSDAELTLSGRYCSPVCLCRDVWDHLTYEEAEKFLAMEEGEAI